jgi:hypothetical protein
MAMVVMRTSMMRYETEVLKALESARVSFEYLRVMVCVRKRSEYQRECVGKSAYENTCR